MVSYIIIAILSLVAISACCYALWLRVVLKQTTSELDILNTDRQASADADLAELKKANAIYKKEIFWLESILDALPITCMMKRAKYQGMLKPCAIFLT